MADLCEKVGADVQDVAKGIGLDKRIGRHFLHAGPGYGGSCFPKDTLALLETARTQTVSLSIVASVVAANDARKLAMVERIEKACGGSVKGLRLAILGVTFKPNTDDMRDSPSLTILPELQKRGASVCVCDPQGFKEGQHYFKEAQWVSDPYEAAKEADALVLLTEWNEFRALDLPQIKAQLRRPLIIDLRNVYKTDDVAAAGLSHVSIGRPAHFVSQT